MIKNIVRVEKNKDNPYVMINKTFLENPALTWKAKGLLTYLLSKPDNWIVILEHLYKQSPDGERAVRSGMNELRDNNHLMKFPVYKNGRVHHWETIITETKFDDSERIKSKKITEKGDEIILLCGNSKVALEDENLLCGNVQVVNVNVENEALLNNDITNNNTEGIIETPVLNFNSQIPIFSQSVCPSKIDDENVMDEQADRLKKILEILECDEVTQSSEITPGFVIGVEGAITQMYFANSIIVDGAIIPQGIVRKVLGRITPSCIEHAYLKFDEYTRLNDVKNPQKYLQTIVYNSVFDKDISMKSTVNYSICGNGK